VFSAKPQVEDGVYILTTKNFDDFVNNEEFTVVEFYAPWCGHCKHLAPEYASASKELAKDDPPIKIAKVDATVETELGTRFGVRGYPTLKIFRFGKDSEYDGPRDSAGIVRYIRSKAGSAYRSLDSEEAERKFRESNQDDWRAAVIFYGSADSQLFPHFKDLSNKFREDTRFGHVHDASLLKTLGEKGESVKIFQAPRYASKLEKSSHEFKPSSSSADELKDQLTSFFRKNILPLAGEFGGDNIGLYREKGLPIVKIYSSLDWQRDPKGAQYNLNRLRKIAKEFEDKLSFVITSKKNQATELRDLDIPHIETPFVIHDLKTDLKYRIETPDYTPEAAKSFAAEFLAGKVESYVKSEAIPENNDGPVKVVVGRTFNDLVLDPTKDVLLEAYAPWCGHCKTLEPKYVELGERMAKYSNSLTIAKIDATANSLPPEFAVKGFPTLFFVPANNKDKPIKYEGAREVEDLVNFVKKEATLPLTPKAE